MALQKFKANFAKVITFVVLTFSAPASGDQAPAEDSPFLWKGRKISSLTEFVPDLVRMRYSRIADRLPTAEACLKDSENDKTSTFGRETWRNLSSSAELEVCLFRILKKIDTLEGIRSWLELSGFEFQYLSDQSFLRRSYLVENGNIYLMAMRWDTPKLGGLFGTIDERDSQMRTISATDVSVHFSSQKGLLWVSVLNNPAWK